MNRRTQRKFSGMAARGWWTAGQAHDDRHAAVLAMQRLGEVERLESAVLQCGDRIVEGFEKLAMETMTVATGGQAR